MAVNSPRSGVVPEAIAKAIESGKAIKDSRVEVERCIQTFRFAAEEAKRIEGTTVSMDAVPGSEERIAPI